MLFIKHHHLHWPTDIHKPRKLLPWWDCPGGQPHTQKKDEWWYQDFSFLLQFHALEELCGLCGLAEFFWLGRGGVGGVEALGAFVWAVGKFCFEIVYKYKDCSENLTAKGTSLELWDQLATELIGTHAAVSCISEVDNTTAEFKRDFHLLPHNLVPQFYRKHETFLDAQKEWPLSLTLRFTHIPFLFGNSIYSYF